MSDAIDTFIFLFFIFFILAYASPSTYVQLVDQITFKKSQGDRILHLPFVHCKITRTLSCFVEGPYLILLKKRC